MLKIVFFDIDGTLLPLGEKVLSKKTFFALKELQRNGVLVCFTSGRGEKSLPHFEGFEADVFSVFNGAYCYNKNDVIYKSPIDKKDVIEVLETCKKLNRFISIDNKECLVANGLDKDLITYFSFGHENPKIVSNFDNILKTDIYKLMLSCSMEERPIILKGTKNVRIAAWWEKAIDLVNANSGKGNGVKRILNYYGFNKDEAMCFGDGENDTDMFKEVGLSVAMGNSYESVKRKADIVCDSVENDGIYKFLVSRGVITSIK